MSIRPSPIPTRPRSRVRITPLRRNMKTPIRLNRNETRDTSSDSTWTISVVPTLAPSITANAGTRSTSPPAANAVTISPVAVLLWRIDVTPKPAREGFEPSAERVAQHASELRAEGARDPGLDHVHAPNQESNCTAEIH